MLWALGTRFDCSVGVWRPSSTFGIRMEECSPTTSCASATTCQPNWVSLGLSLASGNMWESGVHINSLSIWSKNRVVRQYVKIRCAYQFTINMVINKAVSQIQCLSINLLPSFWWSIVLEMRRCFVEICLVSIVGVDKILHEQVKDSLTFKKMHHLDIACNNYVVTRVLW